MKADIFRFRSLSKKMIFCFSALILVIFIAQLAITNYLLNVTVENINREYLSSVLKQKNGKMNNYFNEIDSFSKTVIFDRQIQSYLLEDNRSTAGPRIISNKINYSMPVSLEALYLISNSGDIYQKADYRLVEHIMGSIPDIRDSLSGSDGEMVFLGSRHINYTSGSNEAAYIFIARKILSIDSFNNIGIMLMVVKENEFWETILIDGEFGDYYITAGSGEIISCRNKDLIGQSVDTVFLENPGGNGHIGTENSSLISGNYVINRLTNPASGWNIINVVSMKELRSKYANVQKVIILIGLAALLIAVFTSAMISKRITRPVKELINNMKKVTGGNYEVQADMALTANSAEELKELNGVFNDMTRELRYLINEVYNQRIIEKETELKMLKAQINPHFLYNTLDTIYWMLVDKGEYEICSIVTKLGEILRYCIKKGIGNVTVKDEIKQVENYLFIQKSRFEENLDYDLDIEEGIMDCEIQSFIIQPFVENSINHGIMHSKGKGKVSIKGYRDNASIIFEIVDDGTGIPEEKLRSFSVNNGDSQACTGIGIINVRDRIRSSYGEAYGVDIESRPGSGTRVKVRIPYIKPEEGGTKDEHTGG